MQLGLGEAGELVVGKDVGVVAQQRMLGHGVEVDIHVLVLHIVERPYIIQSSNMVAMGVGYEDGVEMLHPHPEHLLPKVGTDIEQDVAAGVGGE
jgi:hypothetical protein